MGARPPLRPALVQDRSASSSSTGTWVRYARTRRSGGDATYAAAAGATRQLDLHRPGHRAGRADGPDPRLGRSTSTASYLTTVSLEAPKRPEPPRSCSIGVRPTRGTHTIAVRRSAPATGRVDLDAFVILPVDARDRSCASRAMRDVGVPRGRRRVADVRPVVTRGDAVARAMWKGAIQFGLVTIPVKLYLATESNYQIRFNMLHEKDLSRINMKTWCPVDDKVDLAHRDRQGLRVRARPVRRDHRRGPREGPAQDGPLDRDRAVRARPSETTRNARFVKQAYYIEPDKIGRKAFYLLSQVLEEKELTAICKVVIKDREALAAIDPFGDTMLLTTLHWPDEIRSTKELDLPDEDFDFKPAELAMAKQLVAAMTGDFDPEKYKDEYREALHAGDRGEDRGPGDRRVQEPVEESGNLIDLMAASRHRSSDQGRPRRRAGLGRRRQEGRARRRRERQGAARRSPPPAGRRQTPTRPTSPRQRRRAAPAPQERRSGAA